MGNCYLCNNATKCTQCNTISFLDSDHANPSNFKNCITDCHTLDTNVLTGVFPDNSTR